MTTRAVAAVALLVLLAPAGAVDAADAEPEAPAVEAATAARFAGLALDCVGREYPNKIAHVLASDEDVAPPRELTPSFFGCFDWHSAVHAHWLLARLARTHPDQPFAADARAALERATDPERIAAEVGYMAAEDRASWERPYGLAWLLQLDAELDEWAAAGDDDARRWSRRIRPLAELAATRLREWIPKLAYPIRTGEHSQTAFAFGLALDRSRTVGDDGLAGTLEEATARLYLDDRDCPLGWEPSGQDFLSPCLAEADLVRRLLPPEEYAGWLSAFLPGVPTDGDGSWLPVAIVTDRSDGKLAHLDGLNLSRAWMLEGIAGGLPADDPRRAALRAAADTHSEAALPHVSGEEYAGGHWLGSFATYLVTRRGIAAPAETVDAPPGGVSDDGR